MNLFRFLRLPSESFTSGGVALPSESFTSGGLLEEDGLISEAL
jgi:hypothetical protein